MIDLLKCLKINLKKREKMQIIVFKIQIDIINYIVRLLTKKLEKIVKIINKILVK